VRTPGFAAPALAALRRWRPPAVVRSARFRLTALYSAILFTLAALVVGGIYLALSRSTDARPITRTYEAEKLIRGPDGHIRSRGTLTVAEVSDIEGAVSYQTRQTLWKYSAAMLAGLFLASLGIGWGLSGWVLRPIRSIARTADEIQATDLSRRIRLGGPDDELRQLANTIDSMLDRLDHAFVTQRQLIDDASHELRTPLTVIRANLDSALANPRATEEDRQRAAVLVDRATTRMTHLVEDLLATTRRASNAYGDTDVDLGAVAREAGEEFERLAAARDLAIDYDLKDGLEVIGDPDALRRAVGNLISNAVRLAPAGTRITVAAGHLRGWHWIAVRDQGPGIRAEHQERVFDRFWHGAASQGEDRHTGLGLAIVRQIVEAHGGQARLFSEEGVGSTFVLWLRPQVSSTELPALPDGDPTAPDGDHGDLAAPAGDASTL
jgi:signal transduction histidine kinase